MLRYAFEAGDYSSKKVRAASAAARDSCPVTLAWGGAQVTIYITLPSVGTLSKDNVKVAFFHMFVRWANAHIDAMHRRYSLRGRWICR